MEPEGYKLTGHGALSSSLSSSLGGLAQLPMIQHLMSGVNDMQHLDVQNIWVGNVSLVQPVFMGGKIVNYNQITKFAKQLAESMNNLQLQDLIYKTDETYWQVISLVNKKKWRTLMWICSVRWIVM